jgi:hypothetical protein
MLRKLTCLIALSLLTATPVGADFVAVPTSNSDVVRQWDRARPDYLTPDTTDFFNVMIQRIGDDSGYTIFEQNGTDSLKWGSDSRHHYSKDQPWNSTMEWYRMEIKQGGSPSGEVILRTSDYRPYRPNSCSGYTKFEETRWDPRSTHPLEAVGVYDSSGHAYLCRRNIVECVDLSIRQLSDSLYPIEGDSCFQAGIGMGEGNTSNDGRWLALARYDGCHDTLMLCIVDLFEDRVGPVQIAPPCSLSNCGVGHVTVSASGRYLAIKYKSQEPVRIFDIDSTGLTISTHEMSADSSTRCVTLISGAIAGPNGWIAPMDHEDFTLDPNDSTDIVVGRRKGGSDCNSGRVIRVDLDTGNVTELLSETIATRKAFPVEHISTRNTALLGWAYVSVDQDSSSASHADSLNRFKDEVMAVSTVTKDSVRRFMHQHATRHDSTVAGTTWTGELASEDTTKEHEYYRNEPHVVPSPDGTQIAWASNWLRHCFSGCGPADTVRVDYVVNARLTRPAPIDSLKSVYATDQGTTWIRVRWNEPGNDSLSWGTCAEHDLRYSTSEITDANFSSATHVAPTVDPPGDWNSTTIHGLTASTEYWFAIKSKNIQGEWSAISNVICVVTRTSGGLPQACIE